MASATTVYMAEVVATALGWEVARRRPKHWPVPALFLYGLVEDMVNLLLARAQKHGAAPVVVGFGRFAFHVDQVLFLGWYAAVAAVAVAVFLERRPWPVLLGWAAAVTAILLRTPLARTAVLMRYQVIELAALGLGLLSAAVGIKTRDVRMTVTRVSVLLVLFAEFAIFMSSRWIGNVFLHWDTARAVYVISFASISLLQAGFLALLWLRKRRGIDLLAETAPDSGEDTPRPSAP